jgi:hypothetical protein
MWYLLQPPAGTANVVVSLSGSANTVGGAVSFFGVDQAAPIGPFVSASGTGRLPLVLAISAQGDVVVDTLAATGDAVSASALPQQQERWNDQTGTASGDVIGAGSTAARGPSVAMAWSLATSRPWALGTVSLKPC